MNHANTVSAKSQKVFFCSRMKPKVYLILSTLDETHDQELQHQHWALVSTVFNKPVQCNKRDWLSQIVNDDDS